MAEKALTDSQASAKYGATEPSSGTTYPAVTVNNWGPAAIRAYEHLDRVAYLANNCRPFEVEDNDDAIGIRGGRCVINGKTLTIAETDPAVDSLANNDTTYVWLKDNDDGTAVAASAIDGAGWPVDTPHLKLCEVVMTSAVITALVDRRGEWLAGGGGIGAAMLSLHAPGTWAIDADGANTNGGGLIDKVVLTEAAAAYAVVDDGGSQALFNVSAAEAGYTANYQAFPDSPADNDAFYIGHTVEFCEFAVDVSTVGAHSGGAITWEYWNGSAWAALTIVQDNTNGSTKTGTEPFERDGAIHFIPPTNWVTATVNSQSAFWIRAKVSTQANLTTAAVFNSKEHEIVTPADGWIAPGTFLITGVRMIDQTTGTVHTATDVKFILMNFTTGEHTGELTFAQDQRTDRAASLSFATAGGDQLGVLVTQEDGTNEIVNGVLELEAFPLT